MGVSPVAQGRSVLIQLHCDVSGRSMSIEEKTLLLVSLNKLVERRVKGNAQQYANKLGISRATFFRLVDYMRVDLKPPLCYNPEENRYEYSEAGRLHFGFLRDTELTQSEQRNVSGGYVVPGMGMDLKNILTSLNW